jgi:hypothetical protein
VNEAYVNLRGKLMPVGGLDGVWTKPGREFRPAGESRGYPVLERRTSFRERAHLNRLASRMGAQAAGRSASVDSRDWK